MIGTIGIMMNRVSRVEYDRLVFSAILKQGVPTVPKWMKQEAARLSKLVNKTIKTFGGNMEEVWFYFSEELSEEEISRLEEQL